MKALILATLSLISFSTAEEIQKFDVLKTIDGKEFHSVVVTKITPSYISISHENGTASIDMQRLDPRVQKSLGYDPELAKEHRDTLQEIEKLKAEEEKLRVLKKAADQEKYQAKEASKDFSEKIQSMAQMIKVRAFSADDIGMIGTAQIGRLIEVPVKGSMAKKAKEWSFGERTEAVVSATGKVKVTDSSEILWQGKVWRIGMVKYRTKLGVFRTLPWFTDSEKVASAFYRDHGMGKQADEFVENVDGK